ncbi:Rco1p [Nakaseomyces bracarensis]|uniref:Rco1p n=1 Tax=Nakaseomyces bracarensis TaxID=273131 RepID=UPI003871ADAC
MTSSDGSNSSSTFGNEVKKNGRKNFSRRQSLRSSSTPPLTSSSSDNNSVSTPGSNSLSQQQKIGSSGVETANKIQTELSPSNGNNMNTSGRSRPKRSTSQNVDYDLKKRKIIKVELSRKTGEGTSSNTMNQRGGSNTSIEEYGPQEKKQILEYDKRGKLINVNEPPIIETVNGANGVPLGQFPSDKTKKEYLWSFKKSISPTFLLTTNNESNNENNNKLPISQQIEELIVQAKINTNKDKELASTSNMRHTVKTNRKTDPVLIPKGINLHNPHVKTKTKDNNAFASTTKLIGQNRVAQMDETKTKRPTPNNTQEIENDDFCSACFQTGSFLCCDTCPKSFHFLCLNPPLDPDNLPEGDWSCPQCVMKHRYTNHAQLIKAQNLFVNQYPKGKRLFGKLLFTLQGTNPLQFSLPNNIKETFQSVKTGPRGQYSDNSEKEPLTDKQIFHSPYGQSITKLDSYNADVHIDPETGKILTCYRCGITRLGSWSHPEESRLLIKCDYCNTRWHLDCVPDVPRASLKNLGSKWQCPLHSEPVRITTFEDKATNKKIRKLSKNQKYLRPLQSCGFKNDGDIEIALDEFSAPPPRTMKNINLKYKSIPVLDESGVKLDFLDKLQRVKFNEISSKIKEQGEVLEKVIRCAKQDEKEDILALLHMKFDSSSQLQKLWDFKELTTKVGIKSEAGENLSDIKQENDTQALLALKHLIESKPKDEVIRFFNLTE